MFYSSFIVGFEELVKRIIESKYIDVSITQVLNGAIISRTYTSANIVDIPFLNNHFFVFKSSKASNINSFIESLNDVNLKKCKNKRSFRVIISDQNNLVSVDNKLLTKLEQKISKETGNYVNRLKPDVEYWILKRSEGIILFMERISKHKSFDKQLNKGELRDDLCYFLNYLSSPAEEDIFLDPFCGSGAIIKSRIRNDKFNMVFGVDIEQSYIQELKGLYKKRNNIIFKSMDFFNNKFEDDFIDKIVTDPPWGIYENIDNIQLFYQQAIDEIYRIIKPKGVAVILTACKEEMESINTKLLLLEKYNILVSGKKASVYVYQKN